MPGPNQINLVSGKVAPFSAAGVPVAGAAQGHLSGTVGAWLWTGFNSGARLTPRPAPTNQFFM